MNRYKSKNGFTRHFWNSLTVNTPTTYIPGGSLFSIPSNGFLIIIKSFWMSAWYILVTDPANSARQMAATCNFTLATNIDNKTGFRYISNFSSIGAVTFADRVHYQNLDMDLGFTPISFSANFRAMVTNPLADIAKFTFDYMYTANLYVPSNNR